MDNSNVIDSSKTVVIFNKLKRMAVHWDRVELFVGLEFIEAYDLFR
jgi:hypothetical protein